MFDMILVYRYDRFPRSLRQLVDALADFDALGIHFVSLHEGVDTSTQTGDWYSESSPALQNLNAN